MYLPGPMRSSIKSIATRKMSLLIDNLLSFSRQGRQEMSLNSIELELLVHDIIRELEPETTGRNIEWCIGKNYQWLLAMLPCSEL